MRPILLWHPVLGFLRTQLLVGTCRGRAGRGLVPRGTEVPEVPCLPAPRAPAKLRAVETAVSSPESLEGSVALFSASPPRLPSSAPSVSVKRSLPCPGSYLDDSHLFLRLIPQESALGIAA